MFAEATEGVVDRAEPTRRAIRAAASELFVARGFSGTSVREIGRAAGVDAALVIRYFGSKEALFLQVVSLDDGFHQIAEAPADDLGRVVIRRLLERRDQAVGSATYTALIHAAERSEVRAYLRSVQDTYVVQPLLARMGGPDARLRANLVAAQITGLLDALYLLESAELASTPTEDLVELYGRALQTLIDG